MTNSDYSLLTKQTRAMLENCPYLIANLANISALLYESMEDISWVGFYTMENDKLVLGPFQGKVACTEIPRGKGVCGTSVMEDRPIVVEDVNEFKGHIACDSASRSEIVIPVHIGKSIWGVLDIDSTSTGRFTREDEMGLCEVVGVLEEYL